MKGVIMGPKRKGFFCFLTGVIIIGVLSGCPAPVITTSMLVPAASDEAAKLKKIAVLPFDGPGGAEFVLQMESVLAGVKVDNKQYFELVDRVTIDKVLAEHKLAQTGLIETQNAAQIGKFIGAKGIYVGTITLSDVSDNVSVEKHKKCRHTVIKYDSRGKPYEECDQWKEHLVPCTKRAATFEFIPKLIDVESSRIVYSNTLSNRTESSSCLDNPTALPDKNQMKRQVQQTALAGIRKDIAPYYVNVSVRLMDSTDGIASAQDKERFKSGLDFAKGNRLDRACEIWGEVKKTAVQSPSIPYNLGVCAEMAGKLQEALNLYTEADRNLNKPDAHVTKALDRVKASMAAQKTLKEQLAK